jgi:biotin synthase
MNYDQKLLQVLERAQNGLGLTSNECIYLLKFNEASPESSLTRSVANDFTRKRLNNAGVLIGQIGVDIGPCVGGCKFCVFAASHTKFEKYRISDEELVQQVEELTEHGDLYGLYLMTMHLYDKNNLLHMIDVAKNCIHPRTRLWVNIGDTDLDTFIELKKAGVSGAYHVCRLREGIDTKLKPEARLQTMRNILAAEIELQTCCEPIGPEHTVEEVVDNFFIGINMGATSRACMRRTPVPGTPFENSGQISQLRLAQFCAVISLAAPQVKGCKFTSVHEPNQAGFISGANLICAESGANPRDTRKNTQENLGWTTGRCRKLLLESGFSHLRLGDDTLVPLTFDYLERTNSL